MKLRLLVLSLLTTLALHAADAVPVFNATLVMGRDTRFLLLNATGKSSPWLKVGDAFDGFTVKAYDAKASALDLERDGKITRVTLVSDAAVGNAPAAPAPATIADAEAVLKVMRFDDMIRKIADGQVKSMAPMFKQMTAQMQARGIDADRIAAFQQKMSEAIMGVMTDPATQEAMTKAYSEAFTKEELNGLAAFYSTPIGQSLIEKQPEVSQKLNASLMPRMMQVMQGMQKSAMDEFGPGGGAGAPPKPAAPTAPAAPKQ
jgi:hypothetical protein